MSQQPTIESFMPRSKCSATRTREISLRIVDFVVCDLRPAAVVEGEGFKNLLKCLEPAYKVPSSTHISELVKKKYVVAKEQLKDKLNEVGSLGITTDIWISGAIDSYISVVGHFVDGDWKMTSCVLGTYTFPGHHTAVNIVEKLCEAMHEYGFSMENVTGIVHDQASNMQLSGQMLEEDCNTKSISCAAHCLQLCINEGLELRRIARTIAAAKKLVGHFKHSPLALHKCQKAMSMPPLRLQQDCLTRWNSTFYMAKCLIDNRWPVSAVLGDESVTKSSIVAWIYLLMIGWY